MKPDKLYRGIVLDAQLIKDLDWAHMDLIVPTPPIINADGQKTRENGNEYGVYMSDSF